MIVLNKYTENGMVVKEYSVNGKTVSHIQKSEVDKERPIESTDSEPSFEDKVNYIYYKEKGLIV